MKRLLKSVERIKIAAAMAAAICLYACVDKSTTPTATKEANEQALNWQKKRLKLYNDNIYPAALKNIQSGDMITRLGSDITSEMLRQMNQKDQSFSHCGIASIEQDTVFVYHAIGGEFNPDQKIKREPLYSFGHPSENKAMGIFKPHINGEKTDSLLAFTQRCYQQGIPFDMAFDYNSNDRLYCAELVAKAYVYAKRDSSWLSLSCKGQFRYAAVDDLTHSRLMKERIRFKY